MCLIEIDMSILVTLYIYERIIMYYTLHIGISIRIHLIQYVIQLLYCCYLLQNSACNNSYLFAQQVHTIFLLSSQARDDRQHEIYIAGIGRLPGFRNEREQQP